MKIKNKLLTIVFSLLLTTFVYGSDYTLSIDIVNNDELFEVSGELPYIATNNESFNNEINKIIKNTYSTRLDNAKKGSVSKINFNFDVKETKNYVSIILYTDISNLGTTTYVDTFVFNKNSYNIISLDNFADTIMNNLDVYMSKNSKNISRSSTVNDSNSDSFYVDDDGIVLLLDASVTNSNEIIEVPIPFDSLQKYTLDDDDYYINGTYQIMMIPLRQTLENLNYEVIYKDNNSPIKIIKDDKEFGFMLNQNKYFKKNGKTTSLELKPEIINDITYVPISFFSDVLNIYYKVNDDKSITFSNIK